MITLNNARHPYYVYRLNDWKKWRSAYNGGRAFIDTYLTKLSVREDVNDFADRKAMAYCPGFAAAAITEIKNSIFQRITDVQRIGGPETYQQAISGKGGYGVDNNGMSMNTFIGTQIIEDLLVMGKVGVLTDMPQITGNTLADKGDKHPYLGVYGAENILSWKYASSNNERYLTALLLGETVDQVNSDDLVIGVTVRYRLLKLTPNGVKVSFHDDKGEQTAEYTLNNRRIPFTIFEIPCSLMTNVADYQVALLNLESSDISYARKSNFPVFYEFYNERTDPIFLKNPSVQQGTGQATIQEPSKDKEVSLGLSKGRRYAKDVPPPAFINPSPEVLKVSIEKGKQLKEDIRNLVNLNLSHVAGSADSKMQDVKSLESGLSFIGLILQHGENDIGRHWAAFENSESFPAVTYPEDYSLKTEEQRQLEVEALDSWSQKIPSLSYRKSLAKEIIRITMGHRVTRSELTSMFKEIDDAPTLTSDADQIIADHKEGLVGDETASLARGYAKGEVGKAKIDHAERLKRIMMAQGGPENASAARGISDVAGPTGVDEKVGKEKRGTADKVVKDG